MLQNTHRHTHTFRLIRGNVTAKFNTYRLKTQEEERLWVYSCNTVYICIRKTSNFAIILANPNTINMQLSIIHTYIHTSLVKWTTSAF